MRGSLNSPVNAYVPGGGNPLVFLNVSLRLISLSSSKPHQSTLSSLVIVITHAFYDGATVPVIFVVNHPAEVDYRLCINRAVEPGA